MTEDRYTRKPDATYLRHEDCVVGNLYALASRNLTFGVYRGMPEAGFVGIREKFGSEYLFTEYHYDVGKSFGTAQPFVDLGPCPVTSLGEDLGTECTQHRRPALYDKTKPNTIKTYKGEDFILPGTWVHEDDGSPLPEDDRARSTGNRPLFGWLKAVEEEYDYDALRDAWQPGYSASRAALREKWANQT